MSRHAVVLEEQFMIDGNGSRTEVELEEIRGLQENSQTMGAKQPVKFSDTQPLRIFGESYVNPKGTVSGQT